MNRGTGFYPWTVDWPSVIIAVVGGLIFVLGLYAAMRQGRLERPRVERSGKEEVHTYAGVVQSGTRKVTVFIWVLIVVVLVWVIGYVANIAVNGLGY